MSNTQKIAPKPSFIRRLAALLIDYCLILGYMGLLASGVFGYYLFTGEVPDWLSYGVGVAELLGFATLVLPVGLYLYVAESSARQATIGKRIMKLIVVSNQSGGRASNLRIAVRTGIKLLPWELAHFFVWHTVATVRGGQSTFPVWLNAGLLISTVLPLVYIVVVALHSRGRGPHDLVAGTRVIAAKR